MTYGQLRYRLAKTAPGVDLDLIDGWIRDRYTEILDVLPWRRTEAESVYPWPAGYSTGTVTVEQGSIGVVGSGATWSPNLGGMIARIGGRPEFYVFNYVSPTQATLDRPFEGGSGAGLVYRLDQSVFALPSSLRLLRGVRLLHPYASNLKIVSQAELHAIAPGRGEYGIPRYAAMSWDTASDPPAQQLELYPIPAADGGRLSLALRYIFEPTVDEAQTGVGLLPWVRPSALMAGVQADIAMHAGDAVRAQLHESRFAGLVRQMAMVNAQQVPASQLRIAREYTGGVRRRSW